MNHVQLDPLQDGHTNMRLDAELLARAEEGRFGARVFGWSGPWVSLGVSQDPKRAVLDSVVPWVMRPTGGKGVLHGHDVTVGLAVPIWVLGRDPGSSRSVAEAYRAVVPILVDALNEAGVQAVLGEHARRSASTGHTADCFAHVSPNDIVDPISGNKVCGCALKLGRSAVLVQASVPVGPPLIDPSKVFARPALTWFVTLDPVRLAQALESGLERTASLACRVT